MTWLIHILNGLAFGMLLFLLAAGLSLIYGLMRILNLTHGSFYLVGGYIGLTVMQFTGSFVLALIAAVVVVALIGAVIERFFLRHFHLDELPQTLVTFGFLFIFSDLSLWIWGGNPLMLNVPHIFQGSVPMGYYSYPYYRLFLIAVGFVVAGGLWWFQERTRLGTMLRAGVDDAEIARALGINVSLLFTLIFAAGAALAAFAGVLAGPVLSLYPGRRFRGADLCLRCRGGRRAWQPARRACRRTAGRHYRRFRQGVLSAVRAVHGVRADGRHSGDAADRPVRPPMTARLWSIAGAAAVLVLLVALPAFLREYSIALATKMLIFALFAMSLDLLLGYTGLASLGHAAYFGVAAYTVALLVVRAGVSSGLAFPAALAAAAVTGAVFAPLALRARGSYFLMITFALSQVVWSVAFGWRTLTNGDDGMPNVVRPNFGFSLDNTAAFYYFTLAVVGVATVLLVAIVRSPFGRALRGIRESELRMRALGFDVWRYQYVAFVLSAAFAGVAGALYAYYNRFVGPEYLYVIQSAEALIMVILGGAGTLIGPAVGAGVIVFLEDFISSLTQHWVLVLGVIYVLVTLFAPRGLIGLVNDARRRWSAK